MAGREAGSCAAGDVTEAECGVTASDAEAARGAGGAVVESDLLPEVAVCPFLMTVRPPTVADAVGDATLAGTPGMTTDAVF